jgi:hypothetical protein
MNYYNEWDSFAADWLRALERRIKVLNDQYMFHIMYKAPYMSH